MTPRVGVVVVCYNGWALTRACLESLRRVTSPACRIVVVDNASTDGTVASVRAEFPEVHVLPQSDNTGYAGGNNVGIRWCLAQEVSAVLLLNNDTVVDPAFLERMMPHLAGRALVAPQLRSMAESDVVVSHVGDFEWRRGVLREQVYGDSVANTLTTPVPVGMANGCCLLVPADVFRTVGMLDEAFFLYYEDTDFIWRARAAGFRVIYEPRAVVYHHESASSGGERVSPLTLYYNTRNRLYMMRKHRAASVSFLLYFGVTRVAYVAIYAMRGRWRLIVAMLRGIRDFGRRRMARASYQW